MTNEEKQLLLVDLCARLPYKVKVHIEHDIFYDEREPYDTELNLSVLSNRCTGMEIKPFLRSLSSMTDEEREEYRKFSYYGAAGVRPYSHNDFVAVPSFEKMDWLHAHHFDYRGLILKGLALEASEGMYK